MTVCKSQALHMNKRFLFWELPAFWGQYKKSLQPTLDKSFQQRQTKHSIFHFQLTATATFPRILSGKGALSFFINLSKHVDISSMHIQTSLCEERRVLHPRSSAQAVQLGGEDLWHKMTMTTQTGRSGRFGSRCRVNQGTVLSCCGLFSVFLM